MSSSTRPAAVNGIEIDGSGPLGVVLAPISYEGRTYWQRESDDLVKAGYRTVRFDWGADRDRTMIVTVEALRAAGARRVAIVGACYGANVALRTTAETEPDAIVSVSALPHIPGDPVRPRPYDHRVVFIGTDDDPLVTGDQTRDLARCWPGSDVCVYPGAEHGAEIFRGSHRDSVRSLVQSVLMPLLSA